jgi:LacI family transcriptional regulator
VAGIDEVAKHAGVSITTVSRVLNPGSEFPVAESTRRRNLAAAATLRYSPSALAKALVSRCSRMVGVLLGDVFDQPTRGALVRELDSLQTYGPPSTLTAPPRPKRRSATWSASATRTSPSSRVG